MESCRSFDSSSPPFVLIRPIRIAIFFSDRRPASAALPALPPERSVVETFTRRALAGRAPCSGRARASPIKPARPVRRRVQRAGGEGRRYHICRQTQLVTSGGGGGGGGGGCSSRGVGSAVRRSIRARATSCRGCCDGCTWLQGYHAIRQGSMSCDWPMTPSRQSHRPMT